MRAAAVAAITLACSVALAEPSSAFDEGKRLLREGKPGEACAQFEVALREQPEAPGILLNLGSCNVRQNKIATALKWFRRAQTRAAERKQVETEAAAKLQTVELAAKVPTIQLAIAGDAPRDATLTVDGATVDRTSFARLEIDAGTHVVELRGSGIEPARETIEVGDGSTSDTIVTLHARPAKLPTTIVEIDRGRLWRRWGYGLGASGAVLIAGATVLAIVGRSRFDGSNDLATRQRWKNLVHYGGSAMFGLGAAAVTTGIVLLFAAPKPARVERPAIVPVVGGEHTGLAIRGVF